MKERERGDLVVRVRERIIGCACIGVWVRERERERGVIRISVGGI